MPGISHYFLLSCRSLWSS